MHLDGEDEFMDMHLKDQMKINIFSLFSTKFLFEVLLMTLVPIPNYDMYITMANSPPNTTEKTVYTYLLSDFLLAIMVLRIGFFIRAVMKFNIYN